MSGQDDLMNNDVSDVIYGSSDEDNNAAVGGKRKFHFRKSILPTKTIGFQSSTPKARRIVASNPTTNKELDFVNNNNNNNRGQQADAETQETQSFDMEAHLMKERLENNTKLIENLVKEMRSMRVRVEKLEAENASLRSTTTRKKPKVVVRDSTRSHVRNCYRELEEKHNLGFKLDHRVSGPANADFVNRLKQDVLGLDPTIKDDEMNEQIRIYFNSKKYYQPTESDKKANRRKERKKGKLAYRIETLADKVKSTPEDQKAKIRNVLTFDFMSSEESDDETGEFRVRPLRWRSDKCDNIFASLDKRYIKSLSAQAKRQRGKRVMGVFSCRPAPKEVPDEDSWAIRKV